MQSDFSVQPQTKTRPKFASHVRAYQAAPAQNVNAGIWTDLRLDAVVFDVSAEFDVATYRFAPNRSGHYHYNIKISWNTGIGQSSREVRLRNTVTGTVDYGYNFALVGQTCMVMLSGVVQVVKGQSLYVQVLQADAGVVAIIAGSPSGTCVTFHRLK